VGQKATLRRPTKRHLSRQDVCSTMKTTSADIGASFWNDFDSPLRRLAAWASHRTQSDGIHSSTPDSLHCSM